MSKCGHTGIADIANFIGSHVTSLNAKSSWLPNTAFIGGLYKQIECYINEIGHTSLRLSAFIVT